MKSSVKTVDELHFGAASSEESALTILRDADTMKIEKDISKSALAVGNGFMFLLAYVLRIGAQG